MELILIPAWGLGRRFPVATLTRTKQVTIADRAELIDNACWVRCAKAAASTQSNTVGIFESTPNNARAHISGRGIGDA
jgi:hypothetical protein